MLNEKGLEQVRPLSGGIDTWKARRYPLEKRILPPELRPSREAPNPVVTPVEAG